MKFTTHWKNIKKSFDNKSIEKKYFLIGDLVLKWNKAHKDKGGCMNF